LQEPLVPYFSVAAKIETLPRRHLNIQGGKNQYGQAR
jgi:hypothetical protein